MSPFRAVRSENSVPIKGTSTHLPSGYQASRVPVCAWNEVGGFVIHPQYDDGWQVIKRGPHNFAAFWYTSLE